MGATTRELKVECLVDGLAFCEGPRWQGGRLWFSDFYTRRVHALEPGGTLETVCEVTGQPSGLGFLPDGDLLVVSMIDRRVLRLDGRELVELADLTPLATYHLNDMLVDGTGRAYVGGFGFDPAAEPIVETGLIRVDRDGGATIAADGLIFPNGMALTPDGGTLFVAETFAYRISAFDVAPDGALTNRRVWAQFADAPATSYSDVLGSTELLPDGICLDADGALWVSDAHGSGAVRMTEGGEVLASVDTGELSVYAVALGGADRRTLFMCAGPPLGTVDPSTERSGRLLACRVDVPGAGLP